MGGYIKYEGFLNGYDIQLPPEDLAKVAGELGKAWALDQVVYFGTGKPIRDLSEPGSNPQVARNVVTEVSSNIEYGVKLGKLMVTMHYDTGVPSPHTSGIIKRQFPELLKDQDLADLLVYSCQGTAPYAVNEAMASILAQLGIVDHFHTNHGNKAWALKEAIDFATKHGVRTEVVHALRGR